MSNEAKTIRESLKRELGLSSKDVSVRTSGSSVNVTIRRKGISKNAVEEIAERSERISRCEYSGEILSGGNTFVFVEYGFRLFDAEAEEIKARLSQIPDKRGIVLAPGLDVSLSYGQFHIHTDDGTQTCHSVECAARVCAELLNELAAAQPAVAKAG